MKNNKDSIVNSLRQAIAGVKKHFASSPAIVLDGASTTPDAVTALFQTAIDAIDRSTVAEKAFHDAVAAQNEAVATARVTFAALTQLVKSQLGSTAAILGDFGIPVPTRQVPTQATKAAAVAKRDATRKARSTAGKRQKAKVTGESPAAASPTTQPAEPAPAAAPATTSKPAQS
jgi:hypothetical protein